MICLIDDGTLDTVLACDECGEEIRYSAPEYDERDTDNTVEQDEPGGYWRVRYQGKRYSAGYVSEESAREALDCLRREDWIEDIIAECEDEHECPAYEEQKERLEALGFDLAEATTNGATARCSQCAAAVINGVPTHEQGCPNGKRMNEED